MNEMQLYFRDIYIEGDYGWFAAYNCNGVFRINFTTGDVECMGIFPIKNINAQFMYSYIVCYGDQLLFVPGMLDSIGVYDRKSGKLTCKVIPQEITDKKGFCFSVFYENNLMLFQVGSSHIIKYDIETQLFSKVEMNGLEKTGFCFVSQFFVQYKSEKIFTLVRHKNAIIEINLRTGCYRFHRVGEDSDMFSAMCQQDENIWLAEAHSGKLVKYDIENETYQEFAILPDGYRRIEGQKVFMSYLFYDEDWIYIVSSTANMLLRFNITTKLYEIIEIYNDWNRREFPFYRDTKNWVLSCRFANKKIYSLWAGDLQLSVYDIENGCKKEKLQMGTDKKTYKQRYCQQYYQYFSHQIMFLEDVSGWDLKEYMLLVRESQKNNPEK